jgi:hypothetical protein
VISRPRVLFSCVSEKHPSWFRKVQNLVLSIREFGGAHAPDPIVVNFVDGVDRQYERWLTRMDVAVRVVDPVDDIHRYANKLRMLELADNREFDVLFALDCDVVVVGDVDDFVTVESIGAKPADCDMLSHDQWKTVFGAVGLEVPERRLITTSFGQRTYPYVNSGVLLVPRQLCHRLLEHWSRFLQQLQPVYRNDPGLAIRAKYNDQIALACALVAADLPLRPLPIGANVPTHIRIHRLFLHELSDVRIIHYHASLDDDGFLVAAKYPAVNEHLDRFNRRRAELLNLPYGGLSRPSLRARVKHELAGWPWYHTTAMERVKARLKRRSVSMSDQTEGRG